MSDFLVRVLCQQNRSATTRNTKNSAKSADFTRTEQCSFGMLKTLMLMPSSVIQVNPGSTVVPSHFTTVSETVSPNKTLLFLHHSLLPAVEQRAECRRSRFRATAVIASFVPLDGIKRRHHYTTDSISSISGERKT